MPKSSCPAPKAKVPPDAICAHLPVGLFIFNSTTVAARAASANATPCPAAPTVDNPPAQILEELNIGQRDLAQVYLSTSPYAESFEEEINLRSMWQV